MASRLRAWQTFDLIGQAACCILVGYYYVLSVFWGPGGAAGRAVGVLLALGGWQLLSALLHLGVWRRIPGRKQGRRTHLIAVAFLAGGLGLAAAGKDEIGLFIAGLVIALLSPVLAVLYFILSATDLQRLVWQEAGADSSLLPDALRKTGFQAFLLVLTLLPLYTVSAIRLLPAAWMGLLSGLSTATGYALALWLGAELVRYRRAGGAARSETVCAVLILLNVLLFAVVRAGHLAVPLLTNYVFILMDFRALLTVWLILRLCRRPAASATPEE